VAQPRPGDVAEWAEEPVNVHPQKRFVDLSNGEIGLGILNRGLPEYEVVQSGPGLETGQTAVALTLLRCVEWLSRGDLSTRRGHAGPMEHTPEAQCAGHHEFDYALVPHTGDRTAEEALVFREAQAFNTPVTTRAVVTEPHPGVLLARSALVAVEPRELVVSAVKRSNNGQGLVLRIYNPLDHEVEANISLGIAFKQAYMANLLEEYQGPVDAATGTHSINVGMRVRGGGIVTLVFV
jgi:alpha-mannosidase